MAAVKGPFPDLSHWSYDRAKKLIWCNARTWPWTRATEVRDLWSAVTGLWGTDLQLLSEAYPMITPGTPGNQVPTSDSPAQLALQDGWQIRREDYPNCVVEQQA